MIKWGVSAMSHDAALAVFDGGQLVYASHGERYSRVKNDRDLHPAQIEEALAWGHPDEVFFYENHWAKRWRQLNAGQYRVAFKQTPASYLHDLGIRAPVHLAYHHESHAAFGAYTSNFDEADIIVIDSIGESETLTIWSYDRQRGMKKVARQTYPDSVGLWYSAMTQRLGLKPQEHEYILMGMAALGDPHRFYDLVRNDFIQAMPDRQSHKVTFKQNLHRGCRDWRPEIVNIADYVDIAAAVQRIYEEIFEGILEWTSHRSCADNVVIVGGCALNCVANTLAYKRYRNVWVPPNPGDAGSSVGAVLAYYPAPLQLDHAYLGTDIAGSYPVADVIQDLKTTGVSAVASGRAEFGPRALGHRSILADPRLPDVKDRVNAIKHREEFRPFAPMILEEHVGTYFQTPGPGWSAPYMQFAIPCRDPLAYPGIVHVDGSSRVQTVPKGNSGARALLAQWYADTGCPMLLNTSLNIKGEPLVNTRDDAARWSAVHQLPVRMPQ
jgi:carbamoyltransferase